MTEHTKRLLTGIAADLLRSLAVAAGIVVFSFFVLRMIPGDVVDIRGIEGSLTYSQQTAMRAELGLDKPWITQFGEWLTMIASGDLGTSARFAKPIADLLAAVIPTTLTLGLSALLIGTLLGILLPTLAMLWPRRILVALVEATTIWSITVPTFSIGILCVLVLAVWLGLIPAIGNLVVPILILALDTAGTLAKILYEDMKDIERTEYVRAARAKGLSRARIVLRHILPNALTAAVALIGLLLAGAFTGAITMEVVFGLPGLGTLTLQAIKGRDYAVVQAVIIWLGFAVIIANLVTDVIRKIIDPRLRSA